MKKLIITIILLFVYSYSYAGIIGSLFGGPKLDLSKKVTNLENVQAEIKAGVNDVKAGINDANIDLKDLIKLNANINTKLDLQAQVNAKAFAGLDKSETTTAGRDVITTNDPELLWKIINGLLGLCGSFLITLLTVIRLFLKQGKQKAFYKEQSLLHTKDESDIIELRRLHNLYVSGKLDKEGGKK